MTKKIILLLLIFSSCTENTNFQLKADINGLKKGTILLTKSSNDEEVILDSINVNGSSEFTLSSYLHEPEVLKLKLIKSGIHDDEVEFFANEGIMNFNTSLKRFSYEAKFEGSAQQDKFQEFKEMMSKFNEENLKLIKRQIESIDDIEEIKIIQNELNSLQKREILYIVNFSLNNKENEISPYIILKYKNAINTKYLEKAYNSLDNNVRNSKYGILLKEELQL
ncbi:MAG: DUF4369 domain-containing protein [Flavobacteriaceae bacterium]|nr:DUF4369 domain-containing protein [Flavobacteriaceae bacterium]